MFASAGRACHGTSRFSGTRSSLSLSMSSYLVSKVNTYAAANIRVEEGQKVISTGLYGLVRHPMYFGALFLAVGTPLALGSWWTLLLIPLFLPILYFRIANEEKVLLRDLQGYEEYKNKVRYRLIPYIW
ncbi:MAG TPA: isoprenylcysteine carboxylmethyltransferase family protein [Pseudolabrys sp.]